MDSDHFQRMLNEDRHLNAAFSNIEIIGFGSQGGVVRARYQQGLPNSNCVRGQKFALKLIPRALLIYDVQGKRRKHLEREVINNTTLLLHPHIATYKVSFLTAFFMVLVMEYVECRHAKDGVMSMRRVLKDDKGIPYWTAKHYFQQLAMAVEYSHARGVANRDLKLEHCLLFGPFGKDADDNFGTLKICDWGLSKGDYSMPATSLVGTPGYWAPEVIVASWDQSSYDPTAADCFSVGVIFYNFLCGRKVFPLAAGAEGDAKLTRDGSVVYENAKRRVEQSASLRLETLPCEIPQDEFEDENQFKNEVGGCFEVLRGLLEVDAQKRWKMADVVATDWFQRDLPPAAVGVNERSLKTQVANVAQVREEIKNLVVAASKPPPGSVMISSSVWEMGQQSGHICASYTMESAV